MPSSAPVAAGGARASVAILGSDAVLAALPATPTQLVNACFAAGYEDVYPASWGDELLAVGCLDALATHADKPAILCTCPLVREQLRGADELHDMVLRFVSPPVALAMYLRATSGGMPPRITYVGDCPGAAHPTIDRQIAPAHFLAMLREKGISPSAFPPTAPRDWSRDRRRHYSLPGGAPAPQWLSTEGIGRTLVELEELSRLDHEQPRTLVDLAPRLGCACSGALSGCAASQARAAVAALEPPRSTDEIVDHTIRLELADAARAPAKASHAPDLAWSDFLAALSCVWHGTPGPVDPPAAEERPADRDAASPPRPMRARQPKRLGGSGYVLPRAYIARRSPIARSAMRDRYRDAVITHRSVATPSVPLMSREITPPSVVASPALAPAAAAPPRPARREPVTSPRGLAPADRWLVLGVALMASITVASLTSALTVRGLRGGGGGSPPGMRATPETVFVAATSPTGNAAARRAALEARVDSMSTGSIAAAPVRSSPEHLATAPSKPERPASTEATHERPERSTPALDRRAPVKHASPPPAPRRVAAAPVPSRTVPTALPLPAPATRAPTPSPAPARDTVQGAAKSPMQDSAVLAELRAIHQEIEARKRHVDSLTKALDSLSKLDKPR